MKVLLVNGSPHENGCTFTALKEAADRLESKGVSTEIFWLGRAPVAGCIACGSCSKTGKCFRDDVVNIFAEKCAEADGFIFGSPVYYAGISGQLKSFMDRLFYSASSKLRGKPASAVVSCRRGGASAAFEDINKFFMMSNMPVVSSQYWNQVHGSKSEDVLRDEEGMQTMRTRADNMAWLLSCIKAAESSGISAPEREPVIRTNFIR